MVWSERRKDWKIFKEEEKSRKEKRKKKILNFSLRGKVLFKPIFGLYFQVLLTFANCKNNIMNKISEKCASIYRKNNLTRTEENQSNINIRIYMSKHVYACMHKLIKF
jgi:hypothetical protein